MGQLGHAPQPSFGEWESDKAQIKEIISALPSALGLQLRAYKDDCTSWTFFLNVLDFFKDTVKATVEVEQPKADGFYGQQCGVPYYRGYNQGGLGGRGVSRGLRCYS